MVRLDADEASWLYTAAFSVSLSIYEYTSSTPKFIVLFSAGLLLYSIVTAVAFVETSFNSKYTPFVALDKLLPKAR